MLNDTYLLRKIKISWKQRNKVREFIKITIEVLLSNVYNGVQKTNRKKAAIETTHLFNFILLPLMMISCHIGVFESSKMFHLSEYEYIDIIFCCFSCFILVI